MTSVLNGADQRAPVIRFLSAHHDLIPVDALEPSALIKADLLILAQPRLLSPQELVALDGWVRSGGKVLIFADPELHWPSTLPLGDPRRPPPVTLLDPLFAHWGVEMVPGADEVTEIRLGASISKFHTAGRWRTLGSACKLEAQGHLARCGIGKGHAMLFGDADFLAGEESNAGVLHLVRVAS